LDFRPSKTHQLALRVRNLVDHGHDLAVFDKFAPATDATPFPTSLINQSSANEALEIGTQLY
jgi:hypothetical protein